MGFCVEDLSDGEVEEEQWPGGRGPECHGGTLGRGVEEEWCGRGGFS